MTIWTETERFCARTADGVEYTIIRRQGSLPTLDRISKRSRVVGDVPTEYILAPGHGLPMDAVRKLGNGSFKIVANDDIAWRV